MVKLPVFAEIDDDAELRGNDEVVFITPSTVEVGPGVQKYPSLQFAHAHP